MQQKNGMKFSRNQKTYTDYQLDVMGEGVFWKRLMDVLRERIDLCVAPFNNIKLKKKVYHLLFVFCR